MSYYPGQMPLHYEIVGPDQKMNQAWAFWFNNFINSLPPPGQSFVINADPQLVGNQYLYQGDTTQKPLSPPQPSSIFVETDTGKTYISDGPNWKLQDPAYTGDVTKQEGATVLELNTVNSNPGIFGSATSIPVIKVTDKGLVVAAYEVPINTGTVPGGPDYSIQWNNNGNLAGSGSFTFNPLTSTMTVDNIAVGGQITFTTPITTFNNLSPLTTKGDLLTHDGTTNTRLPVGTTGQLLVADSTEPTGLKWATATVLNLAENVPYFVPTGVTYTLPIYKQANFVLDIELDTGGYLDISGYLTELINQ